MFTDPSKTEKGISTGIHISRSSFHSTGGGFLCQSSDQRKQITIIFDENTFFLFHKSPGPPQRIIEFQSSTNPLTRAAKNRATSATSNGHA